MMTRYLIAAAMAAGLMVSVANAVTVTNMAPTKASFVYTPAGGKAHHYTLAANHHVNLACKDGGTLTIGKIQRNLHGETDKIMLKASKGNGKLLSLSPRLFENKGRDRAKKKPGPALLPQYYIFGKRTLSITWITPFDCSTSAIVTLATPPVSSVTVTLFAIKLQRDFAAANGFHLVRAASSFTIFITASDMALAPTTWQVRTLVNVSLASGFNRPSTVPAGKAAKASLVGANTVNGPAPCRVSTSPASLDCATAWCGPWNDGVLDDVLGGEHFCAANHHGRIGRRSAERKCQGNKG